MLNVGKSLERSYTGEIKLHNSRKIEFTLENGLNLSFDEYYRYMDRDDGETIMFSELVAKFETNDKDFDAISCFPYIDDFLMLTSFAARQRCVCLGWETFNDMQHTKYYRREMAIPKIIKDHSFIETIIEGFDFKKFIEIAYKNYIEIESKDLLRSAIYPATQDDDRTVESSYLTFFSSLETLVLLSRRIDNAAPILNPDEWKEFRKELETFIKDHKKFSGNKPKHKQRRKLIYEKVPELNRISFSTAFNNFCQEYSIDLHDLWPVTDRTDGLCLFDIRNMLTHGEALTREQEIALSTAKIHLQWIVERSILAVLGWPVSESKVRKEFLSRVMVPHREWREERILFSEMI